jgi:hypothetical protein
MQRRRGCFAGGAAHPQTGVGNLPSLPDVGPTRGGVRSRFWRTRGPMRLKTWLVAALGLGTLVLRGLDERVRELHGAMTISSAAKAGMRPLVCRSRCRTLRMKWICPMRVLLADDHAKCCSCLLRDARTKKWRRGTVLAETILAIRHMDGVVATPRHNGKGRGHGCGTHS